MQITPLNLPPSDSGAGFSIGGFGFQVVFDTCVEADILAGYPSQNLGTSQYAGPSETAYGVPATEVTYETIGTTPCGQTLRKVVTKTFASRSVANQWILSATLNYSMYTSSGLVLNGSAPQLGFRTFAGAQQIDCLNALVSLVLGASGSGTGQIFSAGAWHDLTWQATQIIGNNYNKVWGDWVWDTGSAIGTADIYSRNSSDTTFVYGSAYYLDVTETWSYVLI